MNLNDRPTCAHQRTEVRRKVGVDGREMFGPQCVRCGQKVGDWMPKSKAVTAGRIADWDESLADQFWRGGRSAVAAIARDQAFDDIAKREAWYRYEYLHSTAWKLKREKVLERDKHTCQGCGGRNALDVHHRTYDNVGDELLFELITLCRGCHEKVHGKAKGARPGWPEYEAVKKRWIAEHPDATPGEFEAALLQRARRLGL